MSWFALCYLNQTNANVLSIQLVLVAYVPALHATEMEALRPNKCCGLQMCHFSIWKEAQASPWKQWKRDVKSKHVISGSVYYQTKTCHQIGIVSAWPEILDAHKNGLASDPSQETCEMLPLPLVSWPAASDRGSDKKAASDQGGGRWTRGGYSLGGGVQWIFSYI